MALDRTDAAPPQDEPLVPVAVGDQSAALLAGSPREWLLPGTDEFFRGIYTRSSINGSELMAVCSAIAGEGKTTIGLGLGITIAQDFPERRVAVVETDFERPALAADFELEPNPGLIDCLQDDLPIQLACRPTYLPNLHLLPVGGPVTNGGRWLRSWRMGAVMTTMRQTYDLVILDVPALLVNSDALLLTDLVDGVLLVVRAGVTPTSLVNKAIGLLDDSRGRLRGVVLNDVSTALPGWLRRTCGLS